MLKNLKCNAIESSYNGVECLEKVRRMDGCIRAVLMDVDMPIMDGV
jgi:YesN/AraC family two-component response regulator